MLPCLRWVFDLFVFEHDQGAADALACFMGLNHIVNEPTGTSDKGVGKAWLEFGLAIGQFDLITFVVTEDDFHRTFGAHDRNFCIGPRKIHIAAQVFG